MPYPFSPRRSYQDAASTSAKTRIQPLGTTDRNEPGFRHWVGLREIRLAPT